MLSTPLSLLALALTLGSSATNTVDETSLDLYGLRETSRKAVLDVIDRVRGGESSFDVSELEAALLELDGVDAVDISQIQATSRRLLYIGVREGPPALRLAPEPDGDLTLPQEIVQTYDRAMQLLTQAVRAGGREDNDDGHSLSQHPPMRAQQEKFLDFADAYQLELAEVLESSRHAHHRAVAATVLAYAADKEEIAPDLARAARDPDSTVRNNAVRALGVMIGWMAAQPDADLDLELPREAFAEMLDSVTWTDRNKSSFVINSLLQAGDEEMATILRQRSLPALGEMARWSFSGHSFGATEMLVTLADGSSDEIWPMLSRRAKEPEAFESWLADIERRARAADDDGAGSPA